MVDDYVFPQLRGLGHSPNSEYYGIADLKEAGEYLAHPILGSRLKEISSALLEHKGKDIETIMPGIDALKLKSSMTLFDAVCPGDIFAQVLDEFFAGRRDERTIGMIR